MPFITDVYATVDHNLIWNTSGFRAREIELKTLHTQYLISFYYIICHMNADNSKLLMLFLRVIKYRFIHFITVLTLLLANISYPIASVTFS